MITIALTSTEIQTAPFGRIFAGTVAGIIARPASITTGATATGFTELGYVNEEGVTITPSVDSNDIKAWQALPPVKTVMTESGMEIAFTLIQGNEKAIEAFFNFGNLSSNGTVAALDVSSNPATQERSLLVTWQDDDAKNYELYFARAFCTDRNELTLQRGEAMAYGMTFRALDNSGILAQFRSDSAVLLLAS